jgi:hypothetical protein
MVTVLELREALKEYPDNMIVTLSGDAEGNILKTLNGYGLQWMKNTEDYELEAIAEEDLEDYRSWGDNPVQVLEVW